MKFSIFLGDIADAEADALCTSTNPRLSLMMGVDVTRSAKLESEPDAFWSSDYAG